MRARIASLGLMLLSSVLAAVPRAQAPAVATGDREPLRIEILGASVSAGFVDGPLSGGDPDNHTVPLQKVVRGWLQDGARVSSRADVLMFTDAATRGEQQVTRAAKASPDLVLAVDFLFWFGHGAVDAGRDETEGRARTRMLRRGLDLLDRMPCPIVVGDLPDVQGAAARMISPRAIPSAEVRDGLNAIVREWAKERPRVRVFPLAALVAEMKQKGVDLPLASGPLPTPPGGLMQGDRLHATCLGMALLGYRLQEHVVAALSPPANGAIPRRTFDEFVAAADAGPDLDDLRAKMAATAPAGASGK